MIEPIRKQAPNHSYPQFPAIQGSSHVLQSECLQIIIGFPKSPGFYICRSLTMHPSTQVFGLARPPSPGRTDPQNPLKTPLNGANRRTQWMNQTKNRPNWPYFKFKIHNSRRWKNQNLRVTHNFFTVYILLLVRGPKTSLKDFYLAKNEKANAIHTMLNVLVCEIKSSRTFKRTLSARTLIRGDVPHQLLYPSLAMYSLIKILFRIIKKQLRKTLGEIFLRNRKRFFLVDVWIWVITFTVLGLDEWRRVEMWKKDNALSGARRAFVNYASPCT